MDRIDTNIIKGITQDSRQVKPGYVFVAVPGTQVDGRDFIPAAIADGATYIIAPKGTSVDTSPAQLIEAGDPRKELAKLAAKFYSAQPETIIAVTGTNGKTSTAIFAQQLWEMAGHKSVSLGTTGIHGSGITRDGKMTTPDPVVLHETLAGLAHKDGVTHLAMEASSHGLDQYRLHGVKLKAAGFTNLTQDHLDYHADMAEYLEAKTRLFTHILDQDGVAVLNADIPEYKALTAVCQTVTSYGEQADDLKILSLSPTAHGQNVELQIKGETYAFEFPFIGRFQIMNALCALGLVAGAEKDFKAYLPFLTKLQGVPGRLQSVTGHPKGAGVYVDYAHTPDALDNVLKAVRPHTQNRLVCIAGCGGDRDKTKRPLMAKIASELSDHVIITDDNPRSEDPVQIRKDMLAGIEKDNVTEAQTRKRAIHDAIHDLQAGDVLVISGKGHEQGQEFADHIELFDDVKEAQNAIQEIQ